MKVKDFISGIENYYGKYKSPNMANIVIQYLEKRYYSSELKQLFDKTIISYTSNYGKPPDIAVFEEVRKKYEIIQFYGNGERQIPKEEKQRIQIEDNTDTIDYRKEISELFKNIEGKLKIK